MLFEVLKFQVVNSFCHSESQLLTGHSIFSPKETSDIAFLSPLIFSIPTFCSNTFLCIALIPSTLPFSHINYIFSRVLFPSTVIYLFSFSPPATHLSLPVVSSIFIVSFLFLVHLCLSSPFGCRCRSGEV